ncbi:MAG: SEL1-like repeat protein [Proteobacteria bacterium]|nr:SEL1-like repeat protein [Pseudomonadota bacterium]
MKKIMAFLLIGCLAVVSAVYADMDQVKQAYRQGDYKTAIKLLRPMAEKKDPIAQYTLALMYDSGKGAPADPAQAASWLAQAAEQGLAEAQIFLGSMYEKGRGVEKDPARALAWYRRAADRGEPRAQFKLGLAYAQGEAVDKDPIRAYMWFSLATAAGHEPAGKNKTVLGRELTADQKARADKLAAAWRPAKAPEKGRPLPVHAFDLAVEPYSGALKAVQHDLAFPQNPCRLGLTRTFRSRETLPGDLGRGWSHNYEYAAYADEARKTVTVAGPDSQVRVFKQAGRPDHPNRYDLAPDAPYPYLVRDGGRSIMVVTDDEKYHFDVTGRLVRIDNAGGQAVTLAYRDGRLHKVTGPLGQWVELSYGAEGRLVEAAASLGDRLRYEYDNEGRLVRVFANGRLNETYRYDNRDCISEVVLAGDLSWRYEYDRNGRVLSATTPFGYRTRYEYKDDGRDLIFAEIQPNGARTTRTYRKDGSGESVIGPTGDKTEYRIDPVTGLVIARIDPKGRATAYEWDLDKRQTAVIMPGDRRLETEYYPSGPYPKQVRTPDGNVLSFEYDRSFNVTRYSDKARGNRSFQYDGRGRVTRMTDFDGNTFNLKYENNWQPVKLSDGAGLSLDFKYDDAGNLIGYRTEDGQDRPVAEFQSSLRRGVAEDLPDYNLSQAGRPIETRDGMCRYSVDNMGQVTDLTYPDGSRQGFRYDLAGRPVEKSLNGKPYLNLEYDAVGNLAARTQAADRNVAYQYDDYDRMVSASYPGGGRADFQYDPSGNMIEARYYGVGKRYEYDRRGRLISSQLLPGEEAAPKQTYVEYTYQDGKSGAGSRTVRVAGRELHYCYGPRGRLDRIESKDFGKLVYEYDAQDQLKSIRYPNGVQQAFQNRDDRNLELEVKAGQNTLIAVQTTRDAEERTISRKDGQETWAFAYDDRGQLVRAEGGTGRYEYRYDGWGNRVEEQVNGQALASQYEPGGRLSKRGQAEYTWDGQGSLTGRKGPQGELALAFDFENRLTRITGPNGKQAAYQYDEQGLMVSRTVGQRTTYILYDGQNPLAELVRLTPQDPELHWSRLYLYAPAVNVILGMIEIPLPPDGGAESVWFFHRDHQGNVVLVTDAKGQEAASYRYDPFGNLIAKTGEVEAPFRFSGQRYEPLFNLYYMRARFYDPEAGRFISRDPVAGYLHEGLSLNPYLYARNRPLDMSDPLGMWCLPSVNDMLPSLGEVGTYVTNNIVNGVGNTVETVVKVKLGDHLVTMANTVRKAASVQAVKDTAGYVGRAVGHAFTAVNFMYQTTETKAKVARGEITVREGKQEIIANTTGTIVGTALSAGAVAVEATTGPVGIALVAATTWTGSRVSEAVQLGLSANDAINEAQKNVAAANRSDTDVSQKMILKIKAAMDNGDVKEAQRLNARLFKFAESQMGGNVKDTPMYQMAEQLKAEIAETGRDEKSWQTSRAESLAEREQEAAKDARNKDLSDGQRAEAKKRLEELKRERQEQEQKLRELDKDVKTAEREQKTEEAEREKRLAEKAEAGKKQFGVSLAASTLQARPNDDVDFRAVISGGQPPFTLSWTTSTGGSASKQSRDRQVVFKTRFAKPGPQWVGVSVRDSSSGSPLSASAKTQVMLTEFTVRLETSKPMLNPGEKFTVNIRIEGGEPPFRLSGVYSGSIRNREASVSLQAPKDSGQYALEVQAVDAKNLSARNQQAIEVGRMVVQGSMEGRYNGSSYSGHMTLKVNGTSVSGSFGGQKEQVKLQGSLSGSYDVKTGTVRATVSGQWKYMGKCEKGMTCNGPLSGSITGAQNGAGFAGTGTVNGGGESDYGKWSVSGGKLAPSP